MGSKVYQVAIFEDVELALATLAASFAASSTSLEVLAGPAWWAENWKAREELERETQVEVEAAWEVDDIEQTEDWSGKSRAAATFVQCTHHNSQQ